MWKHTAHWRDEKLKPMGYCLGAVAAEVALRQAQTQLQGTVLTSLGLTFPLSAVTPSPGRSNRGAQSLQAIPSPRATGMQTNSYQEAVSGSSHGPPLPLGNHHLPLLSQLLRPSTLPVSPAPPPSYRPSFPVLWCTPLWDTHHGTCFKDFSKEKMGKEEGPNGSWDGSMTGKGVWELPKERQVRSFMNTVQLVHFNPVNRAVNLAEEMHLKTCKSAQ